jgi:FtsP/CotA-like multicopper oxidase with cupredoxin domain
MHIRSLGLTASIALMAATGCLNPSVESKADAGHGDASTVTAPFEGAWDIQRFADLNADPNIVEVELEAKESAVEFLQGKSTPAWTFNGIVPGPLLEARVGDQIIVHFRNSLPDPTSIHWHGVRLPAEMDGTAAMQTPVPSGGTFDYRFTAKYSGTFWYHPHVRSDIQVEKGLYGPIVIHDSAEPDLGAERMIVLDDVSLSESGEPLPSGSMSEAMNGRQGTVLLANGKPFPVARLQPGQRERWRLVNAANARYFKLALSTGRLQVVGSDSGLLETVQEVDSLLLVPGERVELLVSGPNSGQEIQLLTLPNERGHGLADPNPLPVILVRGSGDSVTAPSVPTTLRSPARQMPALTSSRTLVLSEDPMMEGMEMDPVFRINGEAYPNITPLEAKLMTAEKWTLRNDSEMDHPFHLHGFAFQVLSSGGSPPAIVTWKDTVNVPAKQSMELAVDLDGFAGRWLYHCHILEHAERGMIGELVVTP